MRDFERWLLLVAWLPLACAFDTATASSEASVDEGQTDGSTGADDSSGPQPGASAGVDTTGAATSTGADTEPPPEDPEDPTDDAAMPRARMVFVDPAPIELGVHPMNGPDVMTLALTNEGDAAASILGGGDEPPGAIVWAGGTFPGTDGTCRGLIPPGAECTVTLAVGPGQPGLVTGPIEVRFDDMIGGGTASARVHLTATGAGPNLVENPDAEADPPGPIMTGWDAAGSSFHTTTSQSHGTGMQAFVAGDSNSPDLTQDVVLSSWADSIDTVPMRFHLTGWSRSADDFWNDDPHDIALLVLDGNAEVLEGHSRDDMTHDGWEQTTFDIALPAGARRVRIRLHCDRNDALIGNDSCSAWFDDFFGGLVLPAQ